MMLIRVLSAVIAAIIVFAAIFIQPFILFVLVFIVALIGLFEYFRSIKTIGHNPMAFVGYFISIISYVTTALCIIYKIKFEISYLSGYIICTFLLMLAFVLINPKKYSFVDMSLTLFGVAYVSIQLLYIISIRFLNNGQFVLSLMLIGVFASDSFALFAGKIFGKHQLIAKISPKKTVEGSIGCVFGGVIFTLCCGLLLKYVNINIPLYHLLIIGLIISIVAQFGDLMASSIKRKCGIKDFGTIMPGHGGVLDRIDSILFVAPVFYFYVMTFLLDYIN